MFSKEWFIYIFGRWILLSGIAGALLQFLLADKLGIWTIPAFLINQLILGCIFWYVDKYIFKKHFGKIKEVVFKFPKIKGAFTLKDQSDKIKEESDQLFNSNGLFSFSPPEDLQLMPGIVADDEKEELPNEDWLLRFADVHHAVDMTERLLIDKGIDIDRVYERVRERNKRRGLYNG